MEEKQRKKSQWWTHAFMGAFMGLCFHRKIQYLDAAFRFLDGIHLLAKLASQRQINVKENAWI